MRYYHRISVICVCLATFQISKAVYKTLYLLFGNVFHQPKFGDPGTWAVITGATEEMGIAFAEILAAKGINLIIYGSSEDDLDDLAQYLNCRYSVQVVFFEIDFTKTRNIYNEIEAELQKYTIEVLINAASAEQYYPELFVDVPYTALEYRRCYNHSSYTKIININILPVTHLCRIVIPGMLNRKRGIIINISSGISTVPSPMLAVFSASKTYINKFSADLKAEYGKQGITILCLTPGLITYGNKPKFWMSLVRPSPERYIWYALRNVGIRDQTYGYLPHSIIFYVLRILNYLSKYYSRHLMMKWAGEIKTAALACRIRKNDEFKFWK